MSDLNEMKATEHVLYEVARERSRQDLKWGEQNHPLLDPELAGRDPRRMADEYEVPTVVRGQFLCQNAAKRGAVTWGHILVEEVAEFIGTKADDVVAMRAELVQIAAVAVAAIECLDRKYPF